MGRIFASPLPGLWHTTQYRPERQSRGRKLEEIANHVPNGMSYERVSVASPLPPAKREEMEARYRGDGGIRYDVTMKDG